MTCLTIEKGIPLPRMHGRRINRTRYSDECRLKTRWDLLPISKAPAYFSIVVPLQNDVQAAYGWARRRGRVFTCEKCEGGFRIWRLE